jgi:hypothetical protein
MRPAIEAASTGLRLPRPRLLVAAWGNAEKPFQGLQDGSNTLGAFRRQPRGRMAGRAPCRQDLSKPSGDRENCCTSAQLRSTRPRRSPLPSVGVPPVCCAELWAHIPQSARVVSDKPDCRSPRGQIWICVPPRKELDHRTLPGLSHVGLWSAVDRRRVTIPSRTPVLRISTNDGDGIGHVTRVTKGRTTR